MWASYCTCLHCIWLDYFPPNQGLPPVRTTTTSTSRFMASPSLLNRLYSLIVFGFCCEFCLSNEGGDAPPFIACWLLSLGAACKVLCYGSTCGKQHQTQNLPAFCFLHSRLVFVCELLGQRFCALSPLLVLWLVGLPLAALFEHPVNEDGAERSDGCS